MPRARVRQGTSRIWAFLTAYLPRECASRLAYISDHLTIEFFELFHSIIAPLKGSHVERKGTWTRADLI